MKKKNDFLIKLIIILLFLLVLFSQYQIFSKLEKIEQQLTISQKKTKNKDKTLPFNDKDWDIHIH
ncbi:hypothetical protein C6B37_02730 [Candidatus Phytoplasma phoenicium]|uniref:Uncharacterized protein n=1 Tax=Candidatus Phytoplasma phoenicium TaxID=198422 RepID=A0A2S8NSR9_9MOLU|nr:hypothetical protein C6B37_02730 [Candidatus Phytoplasma phoenicium]